MKKYVAVLLCLILAAMLGGCAQEKDARLATVGSYLACDCSEGQVVEYSDSHGGIQGDGVLYAVLQFKKFPFEEDARWRALPAAGNVAELMWHSTLTELPTLPEAANGAYLFRDRHDDADDEYDDSEVLSRTSYSFTVALFDSDSNRLYVIAYDS